MTETILVFKPPASLLDVIDVADENGWEEAQRFLRDERRLEEVIYQLPDGETVVRGIDDHFVVIVYAAITGPRRAEAEQKLRSGGRVLDEATLWQWASGKKAEERAFALRAFAATSQKAADPRVVSLYQAAVQDDNPDVRKALVDSVGRAAWPELWPVVDALAKGGDADSKGLQQAYEKHLSRSSDQPR